MSNPARAAEVQTNTHLPSHLLPIEQAQVIFDMLCEGCTLDEMYAEHLAFMRETNKDVRPWYAKQRLDEILINRWRYNPDIDEVAVERAYDGDREVWINLTHYERVIVMDRLRAVWNGTRPHRKWPDVEVGNGIIEWAASVGETEQRITNRGRELSGQRSGA